MSVLLRKEAVTKDAETLKDPSIATVLQGMGWQ